MQTSFSISASEEKEEREKDLLASYHVLNFSHSSSNLKIPGTETINLQSVSNFKSTLVVQWIISVMIAKQWLWSVKRMIEWWIFGEF